MPKVSSLRLLAVICVLLLFLSACAVYAGVFSPGGNPLIDTPVGIDNTAARGTSSPAPAADPSVDPYDLPSEAPDLPSFLSEAPEDWSTSSPTSAPVASPPKTSLPKDTPAFYLPQNEERYQAFMAANPEIPFDTLVAYVNACVDIPHYSDTILVENPDDILVMCNKTYRLPSEYAPQDLVPVAGLSSGYMRAEAAEQWAALYADMRADGLRIYPRSAYRSYNRQASLYQSYSARDGAARADTYSARAGHSEHQTGLTLDVVQGTGYSSLSSARFEDSAQYKWFCDNAAQYGFILRYPKGYEHITGYRYEPWHWRYIGVEAARQMKQEGIATLEEYCGRYLLPQTLQ